MVSNFRSDEDKYLTFAEKDVLKALQRSGKTRLSQPLPLPLVRSLAASAGQKHTGNIESLITSLAAKGYLRKYGLTPPRFARDHLQSVPFHVELKHHRSEIVREGAPFATFFCSNGERVTA
jgi:hypothetical protein